jgi:ATP dependent DNA ligase C terminal region
MKSIVLALRCLRKSSFSPMSWRSSTRPSSLVTSSVIAVSIATFSPIDCISGSARPTKLAHSTSSVPIDDFGRSGRAWRETDVEVTDLETVLLDVLEGQYKNPLRVVGFNTVEKWSEDVSADVAREIRQPQKGNELIYAGKVDHRLDNASAKDLQARLKPLIRKMQPYSKKIAHRGIWVEPSLLAEIEYRRSQHREKYVIHSLRLLGRICNGENLDLRRGRHASAIRPRGRSALVASRNEPNGVAVECQLCEQRPAGTADLYGVPRATTELTPHLPVVK